MTKPKYNVGNTVYRFGSKGIEKCEITRVTSEFRRHHYQINNKFTVKVDSLFSNRKECLEMIKKMCNEVGL